MNKFKKLFMISLATIGVVSSSVAIGYGFNGLTKYSIRAEGNYQIIISQTNGNVTTGYADKIQYVEAKTQTNQNVTFGYKYCMKPVDDSNGECIQMKADKGQYFNVDAITNIKNIKVDFNSSDSNGIKYAVSNTQNPQDFTYSKDGNIDLSATLASNYFFTLAAGSNATYVKGITINYTCSQYIDGSSSPEEGGNQDSSEGTNPNKPTETVKTLTLDKNHGNVTGNDYHDGSVIVDSINFKYTHCYTNTNNLAQMNKGSTYFNVTPLKLKTIEINYTEGTKSAPLISYGATTSPTSNQVAIESGKIYDIPAGNEYFMVEGPKYTLINNIIITFTGTGSGGGNVSPDTGSSETNPDNSSSSETGNSDHNYPDSGNYGEYYSNVTPGMNGNNLLLTLRKIITKGHKNPGYDGLYEVYKKSDTRSDGKVNDIYSNISNFRHVTDKAGTYKKEGDVYNREHTIPQSWWGGGTGNQGSDPWVVWPSDGYINNMRSSFPFGEVSSIKKASANNYSLLGTSAYSDYNATQVFEPNDEYKGDLARSYFYALTRYENAPNWTNNSGSSTFTKNGNYGLTTYGSKLLLKWHFQDPVSPFEMNRNNAIYETCYNRNPYVDHPEFVEKIWGNVHY